MHDLGKRESSSHGQHSSAASPQSVGSLPSPGGLQAPGLDAYGSWGPRGGGSATGPAPRLLSGRWRKALRAERNLGLVLWAALAMVLFLLSRR